MNIFEAEAREGENRETFAPLIGSLLLLRVMPFAQLIGLTEINGGFLLPLRLPASPLNTHLEHGLPKLREIPTRSWSG